MAYIEIYTLKNGYFTAILLPILFFKLYLKTKRCPPRGGHL